jgi:hypothetical protein
LEECQLLPLARPTRTIQSEPGTLIEFQRQRIISPGCPTLGTLNAFFPRGAYFGPKFALIGPANLLSVQPQFVFHPLRNVTGTFEWIWFWRESTKDALYSFGNVPIRPASLSSARFVGSQPNLEIRWAISEHFLAALNLAGFVPGEFLKQSPLSNAIVFFNLGLTYRF